MAKLRVVSGGSKVLSEEQEQRRRRILENLDPRGHGLFAEENFEGDDLYLLLAPSERGGTEVKSTRLPVELTNACDYLLATRSTPFRNFSELVKSALVLLLKTLADQGRGDSSWRTAVRVINVGIARARVERKSGDMATYLEVSGASIRDLMGRGDGQGALDLYNEIKGQIEKLDDSQWRETGRQWVEDMGQVVASLKVAPQEQKKRIKLAAAPAKVVKVKGKPAKQEKGASK